MKANYSWLQCHGCQQKTGFPGPQKASTVGIMSPLFELVPLTPKFRSQADTVCEVSLCHSLETPASYESAENKPTSTFTPDGKFLFIILDNNQIFSLPWREMMYLPRLSAVQTSLRVYTKAVCSKGLQQEGPGENASPHVMAIRTEGYGAFRSQALLFLLYTQWFI